jgi:hypothetical protein
MFGYLFVISSRLKLNGTRNNDFVSMNANANL